MAFTDSARVLAQGAVWRSTGSRRAGRSLVEAACAADDDAATLAGMMLTRGGDRAVPLIDEAISEGLEAPILADILMSVGSDKAKVALQHAAESESTELRKAAEDSLATLRRIESRGDPQGSS